ncbi:PqiB family protein [Rhodopila globiformis]|nr:MlaD family protein [Rhodopila globiformis]
MNLEPAAPAQAKLSRRSRIPLIWLIPIVTLLIGAWLAWDTFSRRGPTITITFDSGEGLQAGQSHIKHKDVVLGLVTDVQLSPDGSHVTVTAEMNRQAIPFLTDQTRFWVVTPRLFAGQISGLDTLISGAYIELLPGPEHGRLATSFAGLETPPVLTSNEPGRTFLLHASKVGSVSVGSPVFFRDLNVGTVLGWDVGHMVEQVTIHAFVRAPYDSYVHDGSRFWNASGVSVKLGAQGVQVEMESVKALLLGGVAFDTPKEALDTPVSAENRPFPLYADQEAARNASFHRQVPVVSYFPGSVAGLTIGSPVTFQGQRLGQVTGITMQYDPVADTIRIPVHYEIEPERISDAATAAKRGPLENARFLVDHGLRAQIKTSNLLTGQSEIALEFFPDAAKATIGTEGTVIVFPAVRGTFADISQSASEVLSQINQMPFRQIGDNLNNLLAGANSMTSSPETKQTLKALAVTMTELESVVKRLDTGVTPALQNLPEMTASLQAVLANTNRLVASANTGYGGDSAFHRDVNRLLNQLNDTMQSLRSLADMLNRHPEALIRGRTNTGYQ